MDCEVIYGFDLSLSTEYRGEQSIEKNSVQKRIGYRVEQGIEKTRVQRRAGYR